MNKVRTTTYGKVTIANKVSQSDIEGKVIRQNETYTVIDNELLKNLTLSKTILHPGKMTTGHSHEGLEEVYFFIEGTAVMVVDDHEFVATAGSIFLIPAGAFHQVRNLSTSDTSFICVFQKYER